MPCSQAPYTVPDLQSLDVHTGFMQQALLLAQRAGEQGEVPVGAVLVRGDRVLGEGYNQCIEKHDPTAHAEINALRAGALNIGNYRLADTTLYVTVEPCMMCLGAIIHSRVGHVVFAAAEPKAGALVSRPMVQRDQFNHFPQVTAGPLAQPCGQLMSDFFATRRRQQRDLKLAAASIGKDINEQ
ncbi:MAG: tRNA adenosine(34) deaminase TadA [Gammaproteobacteria bacterium TMED92]|nr:MAG: tRNA adenosine(34) deaminase TadA [Gammaproteobacteria bacterium TMED92]